MHGRGGRRGGSGFGRACTGHVGTRSATASMRAMHAAACMLCAWKEECVTQANMRSCLYAV